MSRPRVRDSGVGLAPLADEAGDAGRVADDVPGVVVEVAAHQQVAGEDLLLDDDLLAVLELDDVLHRDDDLEDPLLHVHRRDAALEVLLHLLLVARLVCTTYQRPGRSNGLGRSTARVDLFDVEQLGVGVELDLGRSAFGRRRRRRPRRRRRLVGRVVDRRRASARGRRSTSVSAAASVVASASSGEARTCRLISLKT